LKYSALNPSHSFLNKPGFAGIVFALNYLHYFILCFFLFTFYVFAQQPTQQWAARYVRPSGSSGLKNYLALDKVGNCYVAGDYLGASNDALVIKYNSDGNQQWARTYQGSGSSVDLPYGILADSLGNTYTVLSSGIDFGPYDIITIKYDPQGSQQWIKVFDSGLSDEPRDIEMDITGNICIGGLSGDQSIIIKYNPAGDTLWVRKYSEPGYRFPGKSITVDSQNNVIIAGTRVTISNGQTQYYIIKYDSNGIFQWARTTSFSAITSLTKVKTDLAGNVIVTGMSLGGRIVTLKYSLGGTFQWQAVYQSPAIGGDTPFDMKVDKLNNVIVTGTGLTRISPVNYDYITIKYSSDGDSLWVKRNNGTGNANDEAYALDLDDSNNVYITGRSVGSHGLWDYYSIKYLPNGLQQWSLRYPDLMNSGGIAYNISVDKLFNIYITGISDSSNSSGYVTIKYSQPVGVITVSSETPKDYLLFQNCPNPFNANTKIKYQLSEASVVNITVYDIAGKNVIELVNENQSSGFYEIDFSANDFSSGIYFCRLVAGHYSDSKKMILIK